ncbi:MAG: hypothetical protein DWC02_01440 [Candidatus Poseidoniales archaeon]|nr:MAG: hypothetical protein DWC02_01440 [Candidatus Poseidoniales archaeon]
MRTRIILVVLLLGISTIPTSQAGAPERLDEVGAVFGGVQINATSSANITLEFSELPAIVEDYTATWCTNCVEVEHALDDVEETNHMQQYHFHRFISENEDPLGSQEGDERWIERYEQRIPPTVIFNGTIQQVGSVPASDSLQDDYNANLQNYLDIGSGFSSLGWIPDEGNMSGVVAWNLNVDMSNFPANSTIKSSIWVVEDLAYFPDGSNGENYYHESVRAIIELGENQTGTMEITLPSAYDDNDLEIHLIHEVILPKVIDAEEEDNSEDSVEEEDSDEDGVLPSIGLLPVLALTMFAAIIVQRKQQ